MASMKPPAPKGGIPFGQPPAPPVPAQQQPGPPQSPFYDQAQAALEEALQEALQHHQHLHHIRKLLQPHKQPGSLASPTSESSPGAMGIKNALTSSAPKPVNPPAIWDAKNIPSRNALAGGAGKPPTPTGVRGR